MSNCFLKQKEGVKILDDSNNQKPLKMVSVQRSKQSSNTKDSGGCCLFLPVILATCKAEIWRIIVRGQYRQNISRYSLSTNSCCGAFPSSQAMMKAGIRRMMLPGQPRQKCS
jgi:hypothetical protein